MSKLWCRWCGEDLAPVQGRPPEFCNDVCITEYIEDLRRQKSKARLERTQLINRRSYMRRAARRRQQQCSMSG